jgi:hypothetical protein
MLNSGSSSPTTLTAPNCFVFSTAPASAPTVTAILPSSGKNEGNTRVSIVGSGFVAPLQVFFGPAEAQVLSISYNQIVALSPPATGIGLPNQNQAVNVRVREVTSGLEGTLNAGFQYGPALRIISYEGANVQSASGPFTPVTIHGEGFDAPVKVSLAGWVATVLSVSATEIVVVPGFIVASGCSDVTGAMEVTNINTGETASGQSFTYLVTASGPIITGVTPSSAQVPLAGIQLLISGANFPTTVSGVSVTVGGRQVTVLAASSTSLTVQLPATNAVLPACQGTDPDGTLTPAGPAEAVKVTNVSTKCEATFPGAFTYLLPCTTTP